MLVLRWISVRQKAVRLLVEAGAHPSIEFHPGLSRMILSDRENSTFLSWSLPVQVCAPIEVVRPIEA